LSLGYNQCYGHESKEYLTVIATQTSDDLRLYILFHMHCVLKHAQYSSRLHPCRSPQVCCWHESGFPGDYRRQRVDLVSKHHVWA